VKLWSDFYDLVLPDLPGCPEVAADQALRQVAIAFCEQSLAWRWRHPDIPVVAGTSRYDYMPLGNAAVHAVTWARFNEGDIEPVAEADISIHDWRNATGHPRYVLGDATGITLVPRPDLPGTLTLEVVLKPALDATGVEDDIFREYHQVIAHGAIGRLMLSPNKPYTNGQLAGLHQFEFITGTGAAGTQRARNHTRAPLRTTIMRR
jgi:hypothetical protein